MKKKELLEKIKKQLIEKENEIGKLNEQELAIFILWKLSEEKSFDSNYFFGSTLMREKIYQLAKRESCFRPNGNETTKRNLICVGMSAEYKYISDELGLDVTLEKSSYMPDATFYKYEEINFLSQGEHLFCIVHCKDGSNIKIDLQQEIAILQTKSMPQSIDLSFDKMSSAFSVRRSEQERENRRILENQQNVDLILKKLGYIEPEELYTDQIAKEIISENKDDVESNIVTKILDNPTIQKRAEGKKVSEMYRLYRHIIKKEMKCKNTFVVPCRIEKEYGDIRYSLAIYNSGVDSKKIWMHSSKSKRMQEIDLNCMHYLMENGLEFITDVDGDGYRIRDSLAKLQEQMEELTDKKNNSEPLSFEDIIEEQEDLEL